MAALCRAVNPLFSNVYKSVLVFNLRSVNTGSRNVTSANDALKDHYTNFGYQKVAEHEKAEKVREVFSSVAEKYDIMNDIMSVGIHRLWKDRLISLLQPLPGMQLIDVAGGTGDISIRFLEAAGRRDSLRNDLLDATNEPETTRAFIVDINREMLLAGRQSKGSLHSDISWTQGDAENLPFADKLFDAYTIAFGIRNVTHIDRVSLLLCRCIVNSYCRHQDDYQIPIMRRRDEE